MASLVVLRDGRPFLRLRLDRDEVRVGRGTDCELYVPDARVSRLHFIVRSDTHGHRLIDRSANGTYVNEQPARVVRLKDQDRIQAGSCMLVYEQKGEDAPVETLMPLKEAGTLAFNGTLERFVYQRPVLNVLNGPTKGFVIPIRGASFKVGSAEDNELRVEGAAPHHFQLFCTDDAFLLRNLVHKRPVLVNDEAVHGERPVEFGITLQVGDTRLRLELERGEDPLVPMSVGRFEGMVGSSEGMRKAFALVERFARQEAPVIILGETGTGKELVARALHSAGHRSSGPFVALNCSAINPQLFESELFGHVKGAFTGAVRDHVGAFEAAHRGVLFLDELGELPLELQAKLLRVLETSTVTPVGSVAVKPVSVRIVAATHRNLAAMVTAGQFRADLFYRLFVLSIEIPPLRKRPEDIPLLAQHFLGGLSVDGRGWTLTPGALSRLVGWHWPGNVRELRHTLTRAVATVEGVRITEQEIQFLPMESAAAVRPAEVPPLPSSPEGPLTASLEALEKQALLDALKKSNNNRSVAARMLGIARSTLHTRLRKYSMEAES